MSTLSAHLRLFDRNSTLGWLTMIMATLFLLLPVVLTSISQVNPWWFTMAALVLLPAVLAGFTAETQKNLLCAGAGFLLPGLTRNLLRAQVFIMAAVGITTFLVAFFNRSLTTLTAGILLPAVALASLVLAVYALVLVADFFMPLASPLTSLLVLPYFLYIKLGKGAELATYQQFFSHSGLIITVCAVLVLAVFRLLGSSHLSRRLAEQPYISLVDLYRPTKARQFRNRRSAHHNSSPESQRPLQGIMSRCLFNASRARAEGHQSSAILWETLHLGLATSVPRQKWRVGLYGLIMLFFIMFCGYFDSRNPMRSDIGMVSWFSAFPFGFALIPVIWCQFLDTTSLSILRGRRATLRAGYHFIGWATLAVAMLSGLILAVNIILVHILPTWTTSRRLWSFYPPQNPHIPLLPLLVFPVALVVYLLWQRTGSQFIFSIAGTEIIILFHAALNMGGYGWPLVGVLVVYAASWLSLPWLWRRRVYGDRASKS